MKLEVGHSTADLDPRYTEFFNRFNDGKYFEAHDVLEELWLEDRGGPNGSFYKGLIQIAGAFVHVTKGRVGPAIALLKLARTNLAGYSELHDELNVARVRGVIEEWMGKLVASARAVEKQTK